MIILILAIADAARLVLNFVIFCRSMAPVSHFWRSADEVVKNTTTCRAITTAIHQRVHLVVMYAPNDDRAICDDVDMYLNVPSPLSEDTTITLTVASIECEIMNPDTNPTQVTEIVVEGGTLTINSDDTVQ